MAMGLVPRAALIAVSLVALFSAPLTSKFVGSIQYQQQDPRVSPEQENTFSAVLSDLAVTVRKLVANLMGDSGQDKRSWMELTGRMLDSLGEIINEMASVGEDIADRALYNMLRQLREAKSQLYALAQSIDTQMEQVVGHLNETLINQTSNIDLWTAQFKDDLRHFNDTRVYGNACQLVDSLIHRSTEELHNCCDITIKPIVSLCRSFRALLANVLRIMADVLDRMQMCLEDKNSYLEYMTPCIHLAYDEVVNLIRGVAHVRRKITRLLPLRILYSRCCISVALVEIEENQNDLADEFYKR